MAFFPGGSASPDEAFAFLDEASAIFPEASA